MPTDVIRWRGTCWLRGRGHGPCGGGYEWHHHIRQQTLERAYGETLGESLIVRRPGEGRVWCVRLDALLGDERNIDDTCNRHHQLITCGALQIVRADLPYKVEDFVHEHHLEAAADNEYGPWGDLAAAIAKRTGYLRRVVEAWMGEQRVRIAGRIAPYGSTVPPSGMRDVTLDGRAIL